MRNLKTPKGTGPLSETDMDAETENVPKPHSQGDGSQGGFQLWAPGPNPCLYTKISWLGAVFQANTLSPTHKIHQTQPHWRGTEGF